jgi:hypothetical protein
MNIETSERWSISSCNCPLTAGPMATCHAAAAGAAGAAGAPEGEGGPAAGSNLPVAAGSNLAEGLAVHMQWRRVAHLAAAAGTAAVAVLIGGQSWWCGVMGVPPQQE